MGNDERTREELLEEIGRLEERLVELDRSEGDERGNRIQYRSLVEFAPFPIVVVGRDRLVKYVNRLMPGYKAEDVIGRPIFDHVRAEDPSRVEAVIDRVFETGEPGEYTVEGPRFEGGKGVYRTTVNPIVEHGEVVAVTNIARDITEETRAAEALLESEARYRTLSESAFEGIVIHDKGVIVDVNKAVERMAGYTREELIGTNFHDLLEPDSSQFIAQMMSDGYDRPVEITARHKDGSRILMEVLGKEIPYKGGTARVASVRDIAERKAAETALRESEARYRLLAENVHDVIWTMDLDLNYTYVSPSVEQQRGFRPEEVLGKSIQDVMTPASLAKVSRVVEEVLKPILAGKGDPNTDVTLELEMYRKDGGTVLTEMSISLMLDTDMRPFGILGVSRDVTERKAAREAIDQSESRYRLLAENVEDIIFTLGNDLTFSYVSPSFVRLTGFSLEELFEMGWQGLFSPEALEDIMEAVTEDAFGIMDVDKESTSSSMMIEAELSRKDGSACWLEVNVSAIMNDEGEIVEMLGVARDISERKASQERFMEEKRRAELYLDLFGHDIRNINQGIMSYLELMLMRPGIDPDEADYVKSVLEQATRINDLVAKVQRLTQLRARRIEVGDVDAQPLIHAAVDYVQAKYPDRDVRIETRSSCSVHLVRGSKMLTDVFTSILDNAVRFNRKETVEVDISCNLSEDGKHIRFNFDDRGPGIADNHKDKVFRRLEHPDGTMKGSGLGLTVVWEIVQQLDGRVWVEDRVYGDPGQGSRFVVELPLAEE